ncbi:MAG: AraC family transcriptional regulator [Lachnospiraceae bacterium]|nr:AraC family transcriptional regulator [Lachnospiraceae bacterium]
MFQSKVFKRIFLSYILVIMLGMAMYTAFIVYENYQVVSIQNQRDADYKTQEIVDTLDLRFSDAKNAVQNLRFSSVMKNLYMSIRTDNSLNAYNSKLVFAELRTAVTSRGFSLYGITIFPYGSTKAYSSSGVVYLQQPFEAPEQSLPFCATGTAVDVLGLEGQEWYAFNKDNILYCDRYTYQYGTNEGVICVLIDLADVQREMKKILDDNCGVRILRGDTELFSLGNTEGKLESSLFCNSAEEIRVDFYSSKGFFVNNGLAVVPVIIAILLVTCFFIWLAYWESKRYYQPIDRINQLFSQAPATGEEDELNRITAGIERLIGEQNSYREKMLTISPYAEAGMMQAIVSGTAEDKISILSSENFLDLKRPYYIVSVVNFAYEGKCPPGEKLREQVESVLSRTVETFSSEEMHISYYFRDIFNSYLILNFDEESLQDELFFSIHRHISASVSDSHCMVSMGVDRVRDDITELKEACENATKALDGVLRDSRGEIFFHEDVTQETISYYFPNEFRAKLAQCLEKRDRVGVHELLFDVYKKNLDMDATAEVYRALLDEVHVNIIKLLRDLTTLRTIHVKVERPAGLVTLQEAFDYYDAALMTAIDYLDAKSQDAKDDIKLDESILQFVEEHYCDEDMSLQRLSDQFNVSNKYLLLLFKDRYNTTYLQYIQTKRIGKAAELLREGKLSLTEVGVACGYSNQLTFRRNFKSIIGCNPSEYAGGSET